MTLTEQDVKLIKDILEELRIYRTEDDEPRNMAIEGLYEDELNLISKLGITLN